MNLHKPNLSEKIWRGDMTAIDEARSEFEADPDRNLLQYASTLYSFRYRRACLQELYLITPKLLNRAVMHQATMVAVRGPQSFVEADVLATVLGWLSRRLRDRTDRKRASRLAYNVCSTALNALPDFRDAEQQHLAHTALLLRLTHAELTLADAERDHSQMYELVDMCVWWTRYVHDPDQKARILRKAGVLFRRMGHWRKSFGPGLRACVVTDSSRFTQLKSVAALVRR